jgi:hypothetical protein
MQILEKLPIEIKNKIFLFLSHPVADLIRQRIRKLKLHKQITINSSAFHYDLNMVDFFYIEHFTSLHYRKYGKYKCLKPQEIINALLAGLRI